MKLGKLTISAFLVAATISCVGNTNVKKQIRVAVVDTGLDLKDPRFKDHLCETGHKNFVESETMDDVLWHGTHIAGLIQQYAGNANYCLLIYKYFEKNASGAVTVKRSVEAFKEAIKNGADVINFSAGGPSFDEEEFMVITEHPYVTFVVAAGNDGKKLYSGSEDVDASSRNPRVKTPNYYYFPASYFLPNEIIVENVESNGKRAESSNWGDNVSVKEKGVLVKSTVPCHTVDSKGNPITDVHEGIEALYNGGYRMSCYEYMSGTSQATAIATGKLVLGMAKALNMMVKNDN